MSDKSVKVQVGPGFLGLLTIVFITLKLMGHITWSWLWVLSPLWLPLAIFLGIMALSFVIALFIYFSKGRI